MSIDGQSSLTRMSALESQLVAQAMSDATFRDRLLVNPKVVLAEQGIIVPDDVQIQVMQETPSQYYLVLPAIEAEAIAPLSEDELETVAGGRAGGGTSTSSTNWTGCATSC